MGAPGVDSVAFEATLRDCGGTHRYLLADVAYSYRHVTIATIT